MEPTADTEPFSTPPPPPATSYGPLPPPPSLDQRVLGPGHLIPAWGTMFWIGWLLVAASLGAVWYSSRLTGLSTWWLGPETEPRFLLVSVLPFVAPLGLCVMSLRLMRHLPWYGIAGAVVTAVIAAGDISDSPGYAAIEFAVAGAGLLISVASFAGLLRRPTE